MELKDIWSGTWNPRDPLQRSRFVNDSVVQRIQTGNGFQASVRENMCRQISGRQGVLVFD